jgi:hypothetical protein
MLMGGNWKRDACGSDTVTDSKAIFATSKLDNAVLGCCVRFGGEFR